MYKRVLCFLILGMFLIPIKGQEVDGDMLGSWYMFYYKTRFQESQFGLEGDVQLRSWNIVGDLQQTMVRSGLRYETKKQNAIFVLGVANVQAGEFGEDRALKNENRIYQQAVFRVRIADRLYTKHRLRTEQRFFDNDVFKTRYRYKMLLNVPLNQKDLNPSCIYTCVYKELFINGDNPGNYDMEFTGFDRTRMYAGLGYVLTERSKIDVGIMNQANPRLSKNQLQFSFTQTF